MLAVADRTAAPDPTCLVRVLLSYEADVLVVPRSDGRGVDIPTRRVEEGSPDETLRSLVDDLVGADCDATLLGYVTNVVEQPSDDYPWPTPYAHFAVWHVEIDEPTSARGTWLDADAAQSQLVQRHWWPLCRLVVKPSPSRVHGPSGSAELLDQVLDEDLPPYASALERLGR